MTSKEHGSTTVGDLMDFIQGCLGDGLITLTSPLRIEVVSNGTDCVVTSLAGGGNELVFCNEEECTPQ